MHPGLYARSFTDMTIMRTGTLLVFCSNGILMQRIETPTTSGWTQGSDRRSECKTVHNRHKLNLGSERKRTLSLYLHRHHSCSDAIYLININLRPRAEKENSEKPTEGLTFKKELDHPLLMSIFRDSQFIFLLRVQHESILYICCGPSSGCECHAQQTLHHLS